MSREKQLEEMVRVLSDRLSKASAALAALDDTIDPMDQEVLTDGWAQATIIASVQRAIFEPMPCPFPLQADPTDIISAAKTNRQIDWNGSPCYSAALDQVRALMRHIIRRDKEAA